MWRPIGSTGHEDGRKVDKGQNSNAEKCSDRSSVTEQCKVISDPGQRARGQDQDHVGTDGDALDQVKRQKAALPQSPRGILRDLRYA